RHHYLPPYFFSSRIRPPPRSTLFPYTTLFRSGQVDLAQGALVDLHVHRVAIGLGVVADVVLGRGAHAVALQAPHVGCSDPAGQQDRKSTRLNSSHVAISYAVFCLKKKKKTQHE